MTIQNGIPRRNEYHRSSKSTAFIDLPAIQTLPGWEREECKRNLMRPKLRGAYGIPTLIGRGSRNGEIQGLLDGDDRGTFIASASKKLKSREHWIGYTQRPTGKLHIDKGAVDAIRNGGKSLLAVGIETIEGNFSRGDSVAMVHSESIIAQGLCNFESGELLKIAGKSSTEAIKILGPSPSDRNCTSQPIWWCSRTKKGISMTNRDEIDVLTREIGTKAKHAAKILARSDEEIRTRAITLIAAQIIKNTEKIVAANQKDLDAGQDLNGALRDRLKLDQKRIHAIAQSTQSIALQKDPIGIAVEKWETEEKLQNSTGENSLGGYFHDSTSPVPTSPSMLRHYA